MKDIKQIQEYNRRKIICAVHNTNNYQEALKNEFAKGCILLIDEQYGASKFTITGSWYGGCDYTGESFDIYCVLRENGLKFEKDFLKFSHKTKKFNKKIEIIGKPLSLDRVLLALNRSGHVAWNLFFNVEQSKLCEREDFNSEKFLTVCHWNLAKPTLEEQSEETQMAIYKLLGGE